MAKRNPRHIMVDGQPMVALTPKEYAGLMTMRRQVGGLGARLRVVRDTLRDTTEFLSALLAALETDDLAGHHYSAGSAAPPVAVLLASAPELLHHASHVAGYPHSRSPRRPRH
ncbi:hypothetical protein [Streptomyces virginiae]|uniref:hypothetical protein n=1 Tax=Streptomyces virginiae TaxID=1961 RepID=UPI0035E3B9C2